MPMRYLDNIQPKTRFTSWAWSPVIVLRISLFITYFAWVFASVIAFLVGVKVFDLTTPPGWTAPWAIVLGGAAVFSSVGSITDRWQRLERWATLLLSAMILSLAIPVNMMGWLEHNLNSQFFGAIVIIAGVLPVTRFIYLAAQSGKRRVPPNRDS